MQYEREGKGMEEIVTLAGRTVGTMKGDLYEYVPEVERWVRLHRELPSTAAVMLGAGRSIKIKTAPVLPPRPSFREEA